MAGITIDGRESGTSTGRYVDKLVEYLHKLKPEFDITILTKATRIEFMKNLAPRFNVVESNFQEFTFAEQIGFWRQLRTLNADLVHFTVPQQPILYRGKAITSIHDLTTTRFRNPAKNWLVYSIKQQIYKWLIKRVARKSAKVITISEFSKTNVAQFSNVEPSKITVTYEAADLITEPPETVSGLGNTDFIMYVGRPQPHKNLKRLVRAYSDVQLTHPQLKLVLVGKLDANYQLLKNYVRRQDISGVVFSDFVSEGQLRWLYENTAAYVFPSLSEGFGLPGLEAMAHGAPVVSSNATCLPEIYGEAAHYFDPLDTADMAAKIAEVLDDEKLRQDLIKKGSDQVKKYSWERMAKQTLEVYKKVLGIKS